MSEQSKPGRKPRVTDEEVIAVLRENDDPVLSTAEVADELPIKRRATLTRLQRLAENGVLARKQAGGRNTVWWLARADSPTVEERAPADILGDLDTFLNERAAPDAPLPSVEAVGDDYHARRHRENLERLAGDDRETSR
jgi:predicted ArsR family transcriptional regulator